MKTASAIDVITKSSVSSCLSIRRAIWFCTSVIFVHPTGRASKSASPKNWVYRSKFAQPCNACKLRSYGSNDLSFSNNLENRESKNIDD